MFSSRVFSTSFSFWTSVICANATFSPLPVAESAASEIFSKHKEVKKLLWGGHLWTSGFYANTVGQYASEEVIREYVKSQGKKYTKVYSGQLKFDL